MTTHLLVANPTAQSGKNRERIERALSWLHDHGVAAMLLPTLPEGLTIARVTETLDSTPSVRVVIAMGGDGTFREVAAGLYQSQAQKRVALAMLPTGTANDQGKSFGLDASPSALERNLQVILDGKETELDVGVYRRRSSTSVDFFFDSAGWGLSARVLAERNRSRKVVETLGPLKEIYRDHAVYAGAFLKTFLESYVIDDRLTVELVLDGRPMTLSGITDLVVKNTRVYAGAWVFDRTSLHNDGMFELIPFKGKLDWTSKAIVDLEGNPVTEEALNEIGIEHSKPLRAAKMELTFHSATDGAPLAAQLDGEEWPAEHHVTIEVVPRGVRLIVP